MGQEDPVEKKMAKNSSILAWRIPQTEEPGGYSQQGCEESGTTNGTWHTLPYLSFCMSAWMKGVGELSDFQRLCQSVLLAVEVVFCT